MNESDFFEKELQSWIPRPPSSKVAARLFSHEQKPAGGALSLHPPMELFRWLTPLAACFLAILAISGNGGRPASMLPEASNASYYADLMLQTSQNSNSAHHVFSLSKVNENLEWNVWPQVTFRSTNPTRAASWNVAMTNR